MFLKNYTSEQPVAQSIFKIEQVLIRCGVKAIQKEYRQDGTVTALTFTIALGDATAWPIRVPANVDAAHEAMWRDYVGDEALTDDGQAIQWNGRSGQKKRRRKDFREQAERTAWKIMQEWVEIQLSMIQMKQADWREVFLPYVWDGKQSYYHMLKDSGQGPFAGLLTYDRPTNTPRPERSEKDSR